MQEELEAIDIASRAVDRITRHGRFADFELSNGIILKLKPVPPLLLQAINKEFNPPQPPKVWIEEKGRDEENPNDPEYLKQITEFANLQLAAVNDLLMGVGTEVVSVPDGYYGPEDDDWIATVEFAASIADQDIEINRTDKIKRYLCWLRFYALETGADVAIASGLPLQLAGIREGEIEEVLDAFRGVQERGADTDVPDEIGSEDGDTGNRAARRSRARARGTGSS